MASQGPLSPATAASDATVGTVAWTNPNNCFVSDDVYATAVLANAQSQYLKATNFSFSIPAGSTIDGITVEIEKSMAPLGAGITDTAVRIVKGGVIGATDRSDATSWGTTDAYTTYGSASDLWGETWAVADINGSTFGVVISCTSGLGPDTTAQIDHIRITVNYTPTGGTGGPPPTDSSCAGAILIWEQVGIL